MEGTLESIIQLIQGIKGSAPIIKISKIKMLGAEGIETLTVDLDVQTFWAALPSTLPAATTPLSELTKKDLDLLSEIEKLRVGVGQSIVPAAPAGKSDPFTE